MKQQSVYQSTHEVVPSSLPSWLAFLITLSVLTLPGCRKEEKPAPQAPVVAVAEVVQKDVPIYSQWVGALEGNVNAVIRAEVTGYLIKQNYQNGDFVKKGQLLFQIDPRLYEAALDQAKATLDQAVADVAQREALWETAKVNLARVQPLTARKALSQKQLDDTTGAELSARAALEAARANVGAAQANVKKAAIDLGFTRVTSPIDGIAGIANAQVGNLVGPSGIAELTTVSTMNPIRVNVQISEKEYLRVFERTKNRRPQDTPLRITLADETIYPYKGELAYVQRQIDPRTGTIQVTALFPNPDNKLRPGGFALLTVEMTVSKGALLVPQPAVTELQGGYQIAVVGADNKVDVRSVKVGERVDDDLWIITEGLKPGEKVVAEGVQRVKQGMTVKPTPYTPQRKTTTGVPAKPEAKPNAPTKTNGR